MKKSCCLYFFSCILIVSLLSGCSPQRQITDLAGYTKGQLKLENESSEIDSLRIKRSDSNSVQISFFEKFDDTVVLFLNNKEGGRWEIYEKNNPFTSTGYSGIDYLTRLKKKKTP